MAAPLVTVAVVEDEPLAARYLEQLISQRPRLRHVATCRDGSEAAATLAELRPDGIFLDIRLPAIDGLSVLDGLPYEPHVVFTTAYDEHAIVAFQLGALDYLLKPFSRDRFEEAAARLEQATHHQTEPGIGEEGSRDRERARTVLGSVDTLTRLFVRQSGSVRPVLVTRIERAEADGDYTALIVDGRRLLAGISLNDLCSRLDPGQFLRVHRRHVVNLDFVAGFEWVDGSRLQVRMRDGSSILASRTRSKEIRRLIV